MAVSGIRNIGLLTKLSAEDARFLGECGNHVPFKKDRNILEQGQRSASLFLVQEGLLHVVRKAKGRYVMLGRLEPGSFFGEISLFDPGPTTATVRAVSNGGLLEIRRGDFERFVAERPAAAAAFLCGILEETAKRLRRTDERLTDSVLWGGLLR